MEVVGSEAGGLCRRCGCRTEVIHPDGGTAFYPSICPACEIAEEEHGRFVKMMERLHLRRRYQGATFDNLSEPRPNQIVVDTCKLYAKTCTKDGGRGLYLWGSNGTGKTHLAAAIARTVGDGLFVNTTELFDALRTSYTYKVPCDLFDEALSAVLLILDDFGAERQSEWVMERLYVLINRRYEELTPTIFTTNVSPLQLEDAVGLRLASRIMGTCLTLEVDGPDHRRLQAVKIC